MYFLSSTYRYTKLLMALSGGICSIGVIAVGILTHAPTILIIGGTIWLIESVLLTLDSSKILADIKKQVNKLTTNVEHFRLENIELNDNVTKLSDLKNQFIEENKQLIKKLELTTTQLDKLNDLKQKYEKINANLNSENTNYHNLNEELTKQKEQFVIEIQNLKKLIDNNQKQMSELDKIKKEYSIENELLQKQNIQHAEQITKLKNQLDKLKQLYISSQELLKKLMDTGDIFSKVENQMTQNLGNINDIAKKLDTSNDRFDDQIEKLHTITNKMIDLKFEELDTDRDNYISKTEFENYFTKTPSI